MRDSKLLAHQTQKLPTKKTLFWSYYNTYLTKISDVEVYENLTTKFELNSIQKWPNDMMSYI